MLVMILKAKKQVQRLERETEPNDFEIKRENRVEILTQVEWVQTQRQSQTKNVRERERNLEMLVSD